MHGRLKVKSTEEQKEAKRIEQEKKLKIYKVTVGKIFAKRESKEYDEESLSLTKEVLQRNPDFYTLWNYRREILLFLKPEKMENELELLGLTELDLTESCLKTNPKSYCAWHHRFWSMEYMPNPNWDRELKLCDKFLGMDERNFHCWDYRRLVGKKCCIDLKDELPFTTSLIEKNFSNYSAWHYRSKLLPVVHPGSVHGTVDEETLLKEYEIVQNAAFTDPNDQSVWFYHRWLLGRGTKCFEVQSLSVLAELRTVIVSLSYPITVHHNDIKLLIDGLDVNVTWKAAVEGMKESRLWYCNVPSNMCLTGEASEISVYASNGSEKSMLSCKMNGILCHKTKVTNNANIFCTDISAATKEVLQKELESCEQLYELEPENKWTLFTSVLLMRAINGQKYDSSVSKYLEQLMDIDGMRAHYYQDLKSKFLIENYIENMPVDKRELCLVNKSLTSLHHFEHFYFMKTVNLSSNQLSSLYPLRYLLCVEELILDGNKINDCTDIRDLISLKKLSLKNNDIKSIHNLESLTTCKVLQHLFLSGNPAVNSPNFEAEIKSLLGDIRLDGKQL